MIPLLNSCSAAWFDWMAAMLWQSAMLIAIVWAADLLLRRFAWPQFRYILWMLVFVKLLLPPGFALPTSITSSGITIVNKFLGHDNAQLHHLSSNGQTVQLPVATIQTNMPPSPSRATDLSLAWQTKLMLVWFAGVIVLALWLCRKLLRLRVDRSLSDLPEWLPEVLRECSSKLSMKHAPAIAITSALKCPAVFGIFRPTILFPREGIESLDKKQVSNILLHELMHIKRGDLLFHAAQIALQILYWPNILLWLVRRPMHDLRELCCDAAVASVLRENTPFYRQTLLDVARRLIAEPVNPGLGLLGLLEQPHTIVTRLKYLEKPYGRQTLCKWLSAISILIMMIFVLPMSPMRAGTANQEKPSLEVAGLNTLLQNQEKPRFEVISIKPGDTKGHLSDAKFLPGGRLKVINLHLHALIAQYYEMPYTQVVGGPKLIDGATWDIEARPEEGKYTLKNGILDPDLGKRMVQSMLEDRFKLKLHRETRILPGYELVIAKGGPKLTPPKDYPLNTLPPPSAGGFLSRTKDDPTKPGGAGMMPGFLAFRNTSIPRFAINLSTRLLIEGEKNRIHIVDKTGMEGSYDIQLTWTPNRGGPSIASQHHAASDSETTIYDAIQEQLGLRLAPARLPVPVLVVDEAQMPATN